MDTFLNNLVAPEHISEWINGFSGALGAVLGSLVTLIWTAFSSSRARKRERREKLAVGAFAAYQRLNQIYSVTLTLRQHLKEGKALAESKKQPLCTTTMALVKLSAPLVFTIDELWTVTQVGGASLINNVNSLDHGFNALLSGADKYSELRQNVMSQLPAPVQMQGNIGTLEIPKGDAQFRLIKPKIAELDNLIVQLISMADSIAQDTFTALQKLVKAKTYPLGKKFAVELPAPDGQMIKIKAKN